MIHEALSTHQSQLTVEILEYWNSCSADRTSHRPSKWMELEATMLSEICKSREKKKQVKGEISGIFEDKDRKGIRGLNIKVHTLLGKNYRMQN